MFTTFLKTTSNKTTFFLVATLPLWAGGCEYFRDDSPKEAEGRLVAPAARPDSVNFLTVKRSAQKAVRVVLGEEGWQMKKPFDFPADNVRMGKIISNLSRLRSEMVLLSPSKAKKKKLGLTKPCMELEVGRMGQKMTKMAVGCGGKGGLLAIQTDGDKDVHLVKAKPEQLGGGAPETFMSRQLFLSGVSALKSLSIKHPQKGHLVLKKADEDSWSLAGGWGALPADREASFALAERLTDWRAAKLISKGAGGVDTKSAKLTIRLTVQRSSKEGSPPKKKGTDRKPALRGGKKSAAGEVHELVVSGPCPKGKDLMETIRTRPYPARFCVAKKDLDKIGYSRIDYLEKRAVTASVSQLKKVEWWSGGKKRFSLRSGATGRWWIEGEENERRADNETVKKVLSYLGEKTAVSFQKASGEMAGRPCLRYALRGSKKWTTICVTGTANRKGHVTLRRKGEPLELIVPQKAKAVVSMAPRDFQAKVLFRYRLAALPNLFINRDGVLEKLIRVGSNHKLKQPVFGRPNPTAYSRLGSFFSNFKVEGFLTSAELKKEMKAPSLVLEVKPKAELDTEKVQRFSIFLADLADLLAQGSKAMRLEVGGSSKDGGCFGRWKGTAFKLSKTACETLKTPLAPRKIFGYLADQVIVKMSLCLSGSCRVFNNQRGNKWQLASGDSDNAPSQSSLRSLLSFALGMRALKVARYSKSSRGLKAAGHICLKRKKRRGAAVGVHQDAQALMERCLYMGKETVTVRNTKARYVWVKGRPVIYLVSERNVKRLLSLL